MLESRSRVQKTSIIAYNPIKLSFEPQNRLVGSTDDVMKKIAKPTPVVMSTTKNPKPKA